MRESPPGETEPCGSGQVVVVGSINLDYIIRVTKRPDTGETVGNATVDLCGGGKGGNQAVAAAAIGAPVQMIAMIGEDEAGSRLLAELDASGVDTRLISRSGAQPSGSAFVTVAPDGSNSIIVAPGANMLLDAARLDRSATALTGARVLVLQLEIRTDAVERAIELAGESTVVVLNAAPAVPIAREMMRRVDVLVVNEHEAADLLERCDLDNAAAASALLEQGPALVVLTAGALGAFVASATGSAWHEPATRVEVVDTTGAGDTFVGALAASLAAAAGDGLDEGQLRVAVRAAVDAATRSTQHLGARRAAGPRS